MDRMGTKPSWRAANYPQHDLSAGDGTALPEPVTVVVAPLGPRCRCPRPCGGPLALEGAGRLGLPVPARGGLDGPVGLDGQVPGLDVDASWKSMAIVQSPTLSVRLVVASMTMVSPLMEIWPVTFVLWSSTVLLDHVCP